MQSVLPSAAEANAPVRHVVAGAPPAATAYVGYQIIRRNGAVVSFEPNKIAVALMKAFLAVHGTQGAASASVRETVERLTESVVRALLRSRPGGGTFHIEDVQDHVELGLMRGGHHEVARAYVLYRERRAQERARQQVARRAAPARRPARHRRRPARAARPGRAEGPDRIGLRRPGCRRAGRAHPRRDPPQPVRRRADRRGLQGRDPGRAHADREGPVLQRAPPRGCCCTPSAARSSAARCSQAQMGERYAEYFPQLHQEGRAGRTAGRQAAAVRPGAAWAPRSTPDRDLQFDYLGLQTLYDRYFLHIDEQRIEMPQAFFMRVAMGLALGEIDREARAIEFYSVLSSFDFMSSTPTLFNSGTRRSQLSSCYLTTVADDLDGIYEALKENALLSQVRRRPGQRLDPRARAGQLHQGHQRQEPGRGAVPEGGQRHRGGRQPGRQAQGRGLRLPGDLAPRHRGVPRAAQEHR